MDICHPDLNTYLHASKGQDYLQKDIDCTAVVFLMEPEFPPSANGPMLRRKRLQRESLDEEPSKKIRKSFENLFLSEKCEANARVNYEDVHRQQTPILRPVVIPFETWKEIASIDFPKERKLIEILEMEQRQKERLGDLTKPDSAGMELVVYQKSPLSELYRNDEANDDHGLNNMIIEDNLGESYKMNLDRSLLQN